MFEATKNYRESSFVKRDRAQYARVGAWPGGSPRITIDDTLNCLGFGEGGQGSDRFGDRLKWVERQILYRHLLLEEVIHRTNSTLQRAISAVDAQIAAANDAWKTYDLRALRAQLRKLCGTQHQLYGPGDCIGSSLRTRLSELCTSIFEASGRRSALVALSLKVVDVELQRHQEICLCLIAQELVTNALKHGFPYDRSGFVSVDLQVDLNSICQLTVKDNGVGRHTFIQGAGLTLIKGFARLLDGQLDLEFGQGTTARVSFPIDAD